MAIWGRITTLIAGIGVSRAAGVVVEPTLEPERQAAWQKSLAAIPDPETFAVLVAQGFLAQSTGEGFAGRNGMAPDKFDWLVQVALKAAPMAQTLELWRRGAIGVDLVNHALAKEQVEPQYWDAIKSLYTVRVPADLLAFAHQRGIVDNPADPKTGELLIPVSAPTDTATDLDGNPSPIRQNPVDLDVLAEFQATGWDFPRAAVNARARGLPPAPGELLQLVNRNIISTSEYQAGIGEGDTRNEWRDYLLELRRRLLTPRDYAELNLRGWITSDERDAGAALSGMQPADTELLYKMIGRPLTAVHITQALERGGVYTPLPGEDPDPYLAAARQSNVRPEWYPLWVALKYEQPGAFVVRQYLRDGGDPGWAATKLLYLGWEPSDVSRFIDLYTATPATTSDTHVKSSVTSLITATRKQYIAGTLDPAQAKAALTTAGEPAAAQTQLLTLWDAQANLGKQAGPPPPIPADVEIENLIAQGWRVLTPAPVEGPVAEALAANGYTVIAPASQPWQPTVGPPQGG